MRRGCGGPPPLRGRCDRARFIDGDRRRVDEQGSRVRRSEETALAVLSPVGIQDVVPAGEHRDDDVCGFARRRPPTRRPGFRLLMPLPGRPARGRSRLPSWPALTRLAAIGPPMWPSPMNAILLMSLTLSVGHATRAGPSLRREGREELGDLCVGDVGELGRTPTRVAVLVDDLCADALGEVVRHRSVA